MHCAFPVWAFYTNRLGYNSTEQQHHRKYKQRVKLVCCSTETEHQSLLTSLGGRWKTMLVCTGISGGGTKATISWKLVVLTILNWSSFPIQQSVVVCFQFYEQYLTPVSMVTLLGLRLTNYLRRTLQTTTEQSNLKGYIAFCWQICEHYCPTCCKQQLYGLKYVIVYT